MGIYSSRTFQNFKISKEVYNYLLPVYGPGSKDSGFDMECFITEKNGQYFFIGTERDYKDMLERIKYL